MSELRETIGFMPIALGFFMLAAAFVVRGGLEKIASELRRKNNHDSAEPAQ